MSGRSVFGAVLFSLMALLGCGNKDGDGGEETGGMGGGISGAAGVGTGGVTTGGSGGSPLGGSGGSSSGAGGASGGSAGSGGTVDAGAGGVAGDAGSAGMAGVGNQPPDSLLATGLFSSRDGNGELVLMPGVREFEPRYPLWSDGADKQRYVYLPAGTQIDTTDPDHWSVPVGTKLWKSFSSGGRLVETRLIERIGTGANDFRFSTYYWETATSPDGVRMEPRNLLLNAFGTTHDIPNGMMCDRCHNALEEHVLGFSALQLNHNLGGVTLQTLLDEDLLTMPISTSIRMPGADQATQDALGYLHANCGNCHNDSPGLPIMNIPEPQMYLRVSVMDQRLEDTGTYTTAINQRITGSNELGVDYRIRGGDLMQSAVHVRMGLRMIEDQMPPIGTEMQDMAGLMAIDAWIQSLPPPP